MIQEILIALLFTFALIYLIISVKKQFNTKKGCTGGCSCSSIDLEKIEKELSKKKSSKKAS